MNELIIKKIKLIKKQKKINLVYVLDGDEMSGTFAEPADPDLYQCFERLAHEVSDIMEFPSDEFDDRIEPFGVTYSHGEVMKATITAKLIMPDSDTETVINTPTRKVSIALEDGLRKSACELLTRLEQDAINYLKGKRAQTELFDAQGQPVSERPQIEG